MKPGIDLCPFTSAPTLELASHPRRQSSPYLRLFTSPFFRRSREYRPNIIVTFAASLPAAPLLLSLPRRTRFEIVPLSLLLRYRRMTTILVDANRKLLAGVSPVCLIIASVVVTRSRARTSVSACSCTDTLMCGSACVWAATLHSPCRCH